MSRKGWKQCERDVMAVLGGFRFKANTGDRLDGETDDCVVQVKNRRTLSLAALEALALEMAEVGRAKGKLGVVGIKRSAGQGKATPILLVVAVERGES